MFFLGGHVDSQYKITYEVSVSVLPGTAGSNLLFSSAAFTAEG